MAMAQRCGRLALHRSSPQLRITKNDYGPGVHVEANLPGSSRVIDFGEYEPALRPNRVLEALSGLLHRMIARLRD
jgi:hypothetical protein